MKNPLKQYRFVNRTFKKYWSVWEFAFPDYVNEQQWQLVSVSKLNRLVPTN